MSHLFISYASDDRALAEEVCALLEARGIACWIAPRDVAPGAQWDEAIVDAITGAGAFLLLLTATSNESPFVKNEVNHAFAAKKTIFTFRAEDIAPSKSLGFYLARHHWTDGFPAPIDGKVARLAETVTAVLAQAGAAGSASDASGAGAGGRDIQPTRAPALLSGVLARLARRARRLRHSAAAAWTTAGVLGLALAILAVVAARQTAAPAAPVAQVARFELTGFGGVNVTSFHRFAVSPDGARVVSFQAGIGGFTGLAVRDLGDPVLRPLRGIDFAQEPFFSADGRWVAFHLDGQLRKVPVSGGPPVILAPLDEAPYGPTWGDDNVILYGSRTGIWALSAEGGVPRRVVDSSSAGPEGLARRRLHGPQQLPGRRRAWLFTAMPPDGTWSEAEIVVQDMDTNERRVLVRGATDARFVETGHLLYARGTTLVAAAFDTQTWAVGEEVPIVPDLEIPPDTTGSGAAQYAVSRTGTLLYGRGGSEPRRRLVWVDRQGRESAIAAPLRAYTYPRISPDGTRIATPINSPGARVWLYDLQRGTLTRLTPEPATASSGGNLGVMPVWSPDGRTIVFASNSTSGGAGLFRQRADGAGDVERLTTATGTQWPRGVTSDGHLLLASDAGGGNFDLRTARIGGDGSSQPLIATKAVERDADLAPDGRHLAYASDESGRSEIYVRPFPDVDGGRWQISTAGGTEPAWAKNGREPYFLAPDGTMMAAAIQTDRAFTAAPPVRLFDGDFRTGGNARSYDVAPDGRFLMVKNGQDGPRPLTIVLNWFEELTRRVPR
ncbi:MAG: TIR domain-containing protein [Vicinamibacterales bacterium]